MSRWTAGSGSTLKWKAGSGSALNWCGSATPVDATSIRYLFQVRCPPVPPLPPNPAGHSLPLPFSAFFYSSILFILLLFYSLFYPRPRPYPLTSSPWRGHTTFTMEVGGCVAGSLLKTVLSSFLFFHFFSSATNLGSLCGCLVGNLRNIKEVLVNYPKKTCKVK
jgi:hypothetical protein